MRCGVTGLRPTFGRVPRTGAMTLCWSLDKLGPMTRGVEDAMLVLQAISGRTRATSRVCRAVSSSTRTAPVQGLRVGYVPRWMNEAPATDVDRAALETVRKLGMTAVEVELPDWPYGSLITVLFAFSADLQDTDTHERAPRRARGRGHRYRPRSARRPRS